MQSDISSFARLLLASVRQALAENKSKYEDWYFAKYKKHEKGETDELHRIDIQLHGAGNDRRRYGCQPGLRVPQVQGEASKPC